MIERERHMPFVHSLVRTTAGGKPGWRAPTEIGEAAPHYVSFVIPVDERGGFFREYVCETITTGERGKRVEAHRLVPHENDSFVLRLGKREVWFTVKAGAKEDRRLPYLGNLKHDDFRLLLTEIEPEDPEDLDKLYDDQNTFVIGCEPFTHYGNIEELARE
jgi:hypothetical protein